MRRIFGLKLLLSILWLVNLTFGLPAEYHKNSPTSIAADESRHFLHHHHSLDESEFVPIIPSQIDPHPIISLHSDPQLSPVDFFSSFYRNRHHLSTSRPFAVRHISSSTSPTKHVTSSTRAPTTSFDPTIFGSGDFAVMRGGTFYPEGYGDDEDDERYGSGSSLYDSNTGRPFALPLERPKQQRPQHFSDDPFANFRDFADITAGADVSDFSHLVVIYANRNSTKHEPRNILEQLQLLDQKGESEVASTSVPIKSTKLSKFKAKLRSTKQKQKEAKKAQPSLLKKSREVADDDETLQTAIDYVDPLVADS